MAGDTRILTYEERGILRRLISDRKRESTDYASIEKGEASLNKSHAAKGKSLADNKVQQMVNRCRQVGLRVEQDAQHYKVYNGEKFEFVISHTPSDVNWHWNIERHLRRLGLKFVNPKEKKKAHKVSYEVFDDVRNLKVAQPPRKRKEVVEVATEDLPFLLKRVNAVINENGITRQEFARRMIETAHELDTVFKPKSLESAAQMVYNWQKKQKAPSLTTRDLIEKTLDRMLEPMKLKPEPEQYSKKEVEAEPIEVKEEAVPNTEADTPKVQNTVYLKTEEPSEVSDSIRERYANALLDLISAEVVASDIEMILIRLDKLAGIEV